MFLRCMSPSAMSHAKRARLTTVRMSFFESVESGRTARVTRSIVASYFAFGDKSNTEQRSSRASILLSSVLSRMSKRSTSRAGGMPSGIGIRATVGVARAAAT